MCHGDVRLRRRSASYGVRSSGAFVLVKGVLCRTPTSIEFGSSDGLQVWRGTWQAVEGRTTVSYRLSSYEIEFGGAREATVTTITTTPSLHSGHVTFDVPFTRRLSFDSASSMPATLRERVLECRDTR